MWKKIEHSEKACHELLSGNRIEVPFEPARDVQVCFPSHLPAKPGLSKVEGKARLIHDLASIELQAFELALRTLSEFPDAPVTFREELAQIAMDEARHLKLCLESIESYGFNWGDWPVHIGLWQATDQENHLLERILIVHRYLEGSGLDAGDSLLRRLSGMADDPILRQVLNVIVDEEIGHVKFGSDWYREICKLQKVDEQELFSKQMKLLYKTLPRREKISRQLRKKAGFTDYEIQVLEMGRLSSIH